MLYDDPSRAMQEIQAVLNDDKYRCPILFWAKLKEENWQLKFLEALTIVQDFCALKLFGINSFF